MTETPERSSKRHSWICARRQGLRRLDAEAAGTDVQHADRRIDGHEHPVELAQDLNPRSLTALRPASSTASSTLHHPCLRLSP